MPCTTQNPTPNHPRSSAANRRKSAANSRRGGPRPGAGAPRGNLNALKHGRRSRQFAEIGALIASAPAAREALLGMARRRQRHQEHAEETAAALLAGLFAHARDIAAGRPSPGPFLPLLRSLARAEASSAARSEKSRSRLASALTQIRRQNENLAENNRPLSPQSDPQHKNAPD